MLCSLVPSFPPPSSGRLPGAVTKDDSGSALSRKFRKPLATSNHYFRRARERGKETEKRGGGRERERHTHRGKVRGSDGVRESKRERDGVTERGEGTVGWGGGGSVKKRGGLREERIGFPCVFMRPLHYSNVLGPI